MKQKYILVIVGEIKMLFKKVDGVCEVSETLQDLDNEDTLRNIGMLYRDYMKKYLNLKVRFPYAKNNPKTPEQFEQIRKFIKITVENGIPFHSYMQAQFEILVPWMKKTGRKPWISFSMFLTDKAFERYKEWERKTENKYFYADDKTKAVHAINESKYKPILEQSANEIIHRLKFYVEDRIEITKEIVYKEIKMLARQSKLCYEYIWCYPDEEIFKDNFLDNIRNITNRALSKSEKKAIRAFREKMNEKIEESNNVVAKFV